MKKFTIEINISEKKWRQQLPEAKKIIKDCTIAALNSAGFSDKLQQIELSVLLTNDAYISQLNNSYRNKNKPTNVLSFPLHILKPYKYNKLSGNIAIGDIIFSLETIIREAAEQNKTPSQHLAHLAVHGALHLIGFDHQKNKEAEIMEALETDVLQGLGVSNPY